MAKSGLKILPLILFLSSCSYSTAPSFRKEDIPQAVKDICKKEYNVDLVTKLLGRTLWIYLPLEDTLEPKRTEELVRFEIEENKSNFIDQNLKVNYHILLIEDKKTWNEQAIKKEVNEKIFNTLQVIRRVLFSTDSADKNNPLFFRIITADIKIGFEITYTSCLSDLKKISYGLISQAEYQHRSPQGQLFSPQIIGDKEGAHLDYHDITLEEFLASQIEHRILLKFGKPEIGRNANIDKEVLKIATYTLNIYGFKDFTTVEMLNLASGGKIILNQKAALTDSKD